MKSLFFCIESNGRSRERLNLLRENTRLNHPIEGKERKIIFDYHDIFSIVGDPLPKSSILEHEIKTTDEIPIHTKQY